MICNLQFFVSLSLKLSLDRYIFLYRNAEEGVLFHLFTVVIFMLHYVSACFVRLPKTHTHTHRQSASSCSCSWASSVKPSKNGDFFFLLLVLCDAVQISRETDSDFSLAGCCLIYSPWTFYLKKSAMESIGYWRIRCCSWASSGSSFLLS